MNIVAYLALVLGLVMLGAAATGTPSVVLRKHSNDYALMTSTQALAASISQEYTDMGSRSVLTAFSLDIAPGEIVSIDGVKMDFIVGRRVSNSHAIMNFQWDALSILPSQFKVELRIMMDCNGQAPCKSCPCGQLKAYTMDMAQNASAFYLSQRLSWGNLYQADFLLARQNQSYRISTPSTLEGTRIWLIFLAKLPHTDTATGYEYSFRLPIWEENMNATDLMLGDPDHLVNTTWATWQHGADIASPYYASMVNPQVGLLVGGKRESWNTNLVPSPLFSSVDTPLPSDTPTSNPGDPVRETPPTTTTTIMPIGVIMGILVGVLVGAVLLVVIVFVSVTRCIYVIKQRRNERHRLEMERLDAHDLNLDDGDNDFLSAAPSHTVPTGDISFYNMDDMDKASGRRAEYDDLGGMMAPVSPLVSLASHDEGFITSIGANIGSFLSATSNLFTSTTTANGTMSGDDRSPLKKTQSPPAVPLADASTPSGSGVSQGLVLPRQPLLGSRSNGSEKSVLSEDEDML